MLYGHVIKYHLPIPQDKYRIHKRWGEIRRYREIAMAKRHLRHERSFNAKSYPFQELKIRESVQIQNHVDGQKLEESLNIDNYSALF